MLRKSLSFAVLLVLAIPTLCHADTVLTFLDLTSPVQWLFNGAGPFGCGGSNPEGCTITSGGFFEPAADYFNIYEPDGVTLSDTLSEISLLFGGELVSTFLSAGGTVPLTPFPSATSIIETGSIQTADAIAVGFSGANYVVQFESGEESTVPEPPSIALLATTLAAVGWKLRKKLPGV